MENVSRDDVMPKEDVIALLKDIQRNVQDISEVWTMIHGSEWGESCLCDTKDFVQLIQEKIDKLTLE